MAREIRRKDSIRLTDKIGVRPFGPVVNHIARMRELRDADMRKMFPQLKEKK